MRIGSLFSGIGGLELGLERAGVGNTVWQVEKEPFCRQVLARHWPDAIRYEDVTEVDWNTVEPVEVICGGFPCQDISLAGKGAGLDGERSGLWREYVRAVRVLRPRYVVVENVAALFVRGFDRVLGDLASLGFDAEWSIVSAASVGAPHLRRRVFVLAYADRGRLEVGPQLDGQAEQDPADGHPRGRHAHGLCDEMADADRAIGPTAGSASEAVQGPAPLQRPGRRGCLSREHWAVEPDVGRVADGVPSRVDRLKGLGNAVVPQVAEAIGRAIMAVN